MRRTPLLLAAAPLALAAACTPPAPPEAPPPPAPAGPVIKTVPLADVGLDAAAMDLTADPCADFYQYACGGWVEATEIPSDKGRWVRSFSEIHQRNEQDLKAMLEQAATNAGDDPVQQKLGAFYGACMNETAAEAAADEEAVRALLAQAAAVLAPSEAPPRRPDPARPPVKLERLVAAMHDVGIEPLFDLHAVQDARNATRMIAQVDQGGLGLADRDMYLKDDDESRKLRALYREHVTRLLGLYGIADKGAADAVMEVETAIARLHKTRVERRDPDAMYNKIDRAGLREGGAGFDWDAYFEARGIGSVDDVDVTSVPFVRGMSALLRTVDGKKLRTYLAWHAASTLAPALGKAFVDESFVLRAALTGQKELEPRWKRCIAATDESLGELLAQAFVAKRFSPESKLAVEQMVAAIGEAMGRRLTELPWMSEPTRVRAREKLASLAFLIGYPEKWKTYDFELGPETHVDNLLRARKHELRRELAKIGQPVDRGEWYMTPPTVNAYYDPQKNQMVFPAGILQPPFFDPKASLAVNLGAMGMVVGHELTHGFDDQGSQYDADGNLKSWWEPEVRDRFERRTGCVVNQYAHYEALPGVRLNGMLTLGENIADAGGVKLAYEALRALRGGAEEVVEAEAPGLPRALSEEQQLFVSMAQVWCSKAREQTARLHAQVDPHSPPAWRVNGSLRNVPQFASAFSCEAGAPMRPRDACEVW